MRLPVRDAELVQIMDANLVAASRRAGPRLACRIGCTQCCHGVFAINALDVLRLHAGLRAAPPETVAALQRRARAWIAEYGADFPGDPATGVLGASPDEQVRFDSFAEDAPCPALDPATGRCEVYAWRPMTCRVFGPPVRSANQSGEEGLGHCELCFTTATPEEVAACEMPVPHDLEAELLGEIGSGATSVVAFALLSKGLPLP